MTQLGNTLDLILFIVFCFVMYFIFNPIEFKANRDTTERAIKKQVELMQEISELQREIAMLRNESGVAREVIKRYVSPEMQSQADHFLREQSL
jgi:hypothetical protein